MCLLHRFVQRCTCHFEVQIDQLLETIEYRFLECEKVIDRGFLVGEKLLWDRAHSEFLFLDGEPCGFKSDTHMVHRTKPILPIRPRLSRENIAPQHYRMLLYI